MGMYARAWHALIVLCLAYHAWALWLSWKRGPTPAAQNPHRGELHTVVPADTRAGWSYEFRAPELLDGETPSLQGLTFIDRDTLLVAAAARSLTVLYRVDVASRRVTGRAESRTLLHLNSLRTRANGEVWAVAATRGENVALRLDLDASFGTGAIAGAEIWSAGNWGFSIAFSTVDGAEYALFQQWASKGAPRLLVFRADDISAPIKTLDLGTRIQDIAARDGLLYASRNGGGWVETYELRALLSAPEGARVTPSARVPHATPLAEGIAFRPGDSRIWAATEGLRKVGDSWAHSAVWTTDLPASGADPGA